MLLIEQALQYLALGWSIIPLKGGDDIRAGKRPPSGFRWKTYQNRLATEDEVQRWFERYPVNAVGIVCGPVSHLVVLEFDDADHYHDFCRQYPHLTHTYTVLSGRRKLPHLYFRTTEAIPNRDWQWGSLRSTGKYVVAGGSSIAGNTYEVIKSCPPQTITLDDLQPLIQMRSHHSKPDQTETTLEKAIREYTRWAPAIGRNNALYKVAREIIQERSEEILNTLTKLHAETGAFWQHKPETPEERIQEAQATLESASKHRWRRQPIEGRKGLPNRLRELLMHTQTQYCIQLERLFSHSDNTTPVGYSQKIQTLCEEYNIEDMRSDPLPPEATRSVAAYRMAMHRALIEDRPGQYALDWLAQRLNVTKQTIRNYNERLGIAEIPVYSYQTVNWNTIETDIFSPERRGGITPGYWLQDETGKRWPSIRGLAARLLKEGHRLIAVRREPNIYCFPDAACYTDGVVWRCKQTGKQSTGGEYDFPVQEQAEKKPEPPPRKRHDVPFWHWNLTLVKGIGLSRQYILADMGIYTLEQLVNAGVEKLAARSWPGGYVTSRTVERWIHDALLLLGRRTLTPEEIAAQERKRTQKRRKEILRGFLKFIKRTDNPLFDNLEPHIVYFLRFGTGLKSLLKTCTHQLTHYLEYIEQFLNQPAEWLSRWWFDDHKTWRRRYRVARRQLEKLTECVIS